VGEKRVGIIQSCYVPWRGYFDFIDDVDAFILLDNVQYTTRDWRNRNKIKTRNGTAWITVSVLQTSRDQLIQDIPIDWSVDWAGHHLNLLRENYRDAPAYAEVAGEFAALLEQKPPMLSALNRLLLEWAMGRCAITTPLFDASALPCQGRQTERLISLVQAVEGTTYLSGPAAADYIDVADFDRAGIALEYKSYDYEPYPQLWGAFEGGVSILDLLMMTGADAHRHIRSRTPNRRMTV
jgi:hypothetical protein